MTPLLILPFGIHPATAVGTGLLYAAVTKTGGSLEHSFARSIDWRAVRRLATGSVPATIVTLAVLLHLNLNGDAARGLITLVLGTALFVTAFVLVFGERFWRCIARTFPNLTRGTPPIVRLLSGR